MNPPMNRSESSEVDPQMIPIDGFQQVIEMLRIADPAFRESLLRRLAARDQHLANNLRRDLKNSDF